MHLLKQGIKQDALRRWNLPERMFFACGACHILVHAFLVRFKNTGFGAIWIRPTAGFTGNHVFATNGSLAFDYHGYLPHERLVGHYTKRARRLFAGWQADLVPVSVSLINREEAKTIGLDIREPGQFLHDALPRAYRYLERFDHGVHKAPNSALERSVREPAAQGGR